MQDMVVQENGFKLNYVDQQTKLNFTRVNSAISIMKTQNDNEKIVLFFGGVQQH